MEIFQNLIYIFIMMDDRLHVSKINQIDRKSCRDWVEKCASYKGFAERIHSWIVEGMEIE